MKPEARNQAVRITASKFNPTEFRVEMLEAIKAACKPSAIEDLRDAYLASQTEARVICEQLQRLNAEYTQACNRREKALERYKQAKERAGH